MTLGLFPAVALALAADPIRRELLDSPAAPARRGGHALARARRARRRRVGRQLATTRRRCSGTASSSCTGTSRATSVGFHPESALFCGATPPLGSWFSYTIYRHFGGAAARGPGDALRRHLPGGARPLHAGLVPAGPVPAGAPALLERQLPALSRVGVRRRGAACAARAAATQPFELIVPGRYRWVPFGQATSHSRGRALRSRPARSPTSRPARIAPASTPTSPTACCCSRSKSRRATRRAPFYKSY